MPTDLFYILLGSFTRAKFNPVLKISYSGKSGDFDEKRTGLYASILPDLYS